MIDCSLKEVPVNDRPSCWQLQGDVEEGSWWGHGALDLKRRKTGPAVQILLGQPCVCVGSWPASHFSFWDTAFRTIYSPGHSVRANSKSFSLSLFFPSLTPSPHFLSEGQCYIWHCLLKLQPWFIGFTQWRENNHSILRQDLAEDELRCSGDSLAKN